mmetsp:Transcript_15598/g.39564  ORF Transcript_15598/g.39564 Transcript_15598/m.39564 type:complete len:864 (+) Transcript_15598:97-2688(+)
MSHATYNRKWQECMTEINEQIQIENLPAEGGDLDLGFHHQALLYIKYLQIYHKLEDCHDQMVHPQKQRDIKQVLEAVIIRILQLKAKLIEFNPRIMNRFVALDEVLTDLKLNPEVVEWRVPRWFLDDENIRDDIEVQQKKIEHYMALSDKPQVKAMIKAPDDLTDKRDPFKVELKLSEAIAIIQKNERGRMGINKADMIADWKRGAQRKEEKAKRKEEKGDDGHDDHAQQVFSATRIAAHWKRRCDRKRFLRMRDEEFQFLGMSPPPPPAIDQISFATETRASRKKAQLDASQAYKDAMYEEKSWLAKNEGPDMKAELLEHYRQGILKRYEETLEFPENLDDFRTPDQPAEEAPPEAAAKDAKGKDGKKDEKEAPGAEKRVGTFDDQSESKVVTLQKHVNQYTNRWEGRDETTNFDQKHDRGMLSETMRPLVQHDVWREVDSLMREELANLKSIYQVAAKKKKKGKTGGKKKKDGKKKKSGDGKKKPCCAIDKLYKDDASKQGILPELVIEGFCKKVKPERLENIYGEFQYLGAIERVQHTYCPPPSMQMIKSLIVEHAILPLADADIRMDAPKMADGKSLVARSLLMYGPKGSGKSMLARAIATEAGATFFDLSPSVLEQNWDKYPGKNGPTTLLHKVFTCAMECSPAVIYMDEVDRIFVAGKKGKKKGGGGGGDGPDKIKKDLVAHLKILKTGIESTPKHRVLVIGTMSAPPPLTLPGTLDMKELDNFFDEKIWVNSPDYGSRLLLWKKFMEQAGVDVDATKLNLSALAHVSDGYSSGAIRQTVNRVLTARRIQQLKNRPLTVQEFLGPLSRTHYTWPEHWHAFREFDHVITGEAKRIEQYVQDQGGAEAPAKDAKKPAKK